MNAHSSQQAFESLLAHAGLRLEQLSVAQGVSLVIEFYRNQRAADCHADSDGDMLLFQWGTLGKGDEEYFELDLTRQFILGPAGDDEDMWRLSLTFKFPPSEQLRKLPSGNKWCPRPRPQAVDYFAKFIRGSPAYLAVGETPPVAVGLDYFDANC